MRKLTIFLTLQFIWLIAPAQEQWFSNDAITGLDPPAGFAARNHAVSFVVGDTAYIGTGDGGSATLTDFWKYVPATKEWTQIADFPGHRRQQAVAFVLDGKGYVGTGRSGTTLFDDFYRYDPVTNSWDTVANFGGGDRRNAVAFVVNGKAYVGTGYNTTNSPSPANRTDDLWQYDPATNQWTQKNSIPGARGDAMAFSIGDKGYVAGGKISKDIYEYDPVTDTYIEGGKNEFMYAREDGVAFVLNDQAYIGLGSKIKDQATDFFIFEPKFRTVVAPSGQLDQTEDAFGVSTEDNRTGAIAFVIRGKAFVGLGGYVTVGTAQKRDIWSFQSPIPDTPENLTATTPSQTSVILRWTSHANNETGYEIERSEGNPDNFAVIGVEGVDSTLYERNELPVDKEYFYRVSTRGAAQNSPYSDTVVINTYNPPSNLMATVGSPTEITLQWQDNSTGEQGFIIQRATNGVFSELATVLADMTTYTDATAQPGFDYTYRVFAQATVSVSAASNTVTAGSLINPTDLTADATGGPFVQLNWSYSGNNAARFVIERRATGGSEFAVVANVTATASPQYQDKTVGEAASYEYRVKAEDLPRTSAYSNTVSAMTQLLDPTAVLATVQDSTVTISWNDVSQRETHYVVHRSLASGSELVVLDTLAADISSFLDTASLSAGDYRYIVQALGASANSNAVASNTITIADAPVETEEPGEETPEEEEPDPKEEPTPEEEEVITGTDEVINPYEVRVYPNPSEGIAEINVGSERFAYVAIFNSQGRLVDEVQQAEQGSSATVELDLQHLPVGVYTLRVYTSQGVFVRKIARQ